MADAQPVLIAGTWRAADAEGTFEPKNPATKEPTGEIYPVSSRKDVDEAIEAAARAAEQIAEIGDEIVASFLERFAERIEARADELVAMANDESGLPASPRLADIELPRTTDQLRQAAAAVRDRAWTMPTIDTGSDIRSMYGPLGGGVAHHHDAIRWNRSEKADRHGVTRFDIIGETAGQVKAIHLARA